MVCVLCIIVVAACTTKPPGCPLPEYSKGAVVLVDEVFIGGIEYTISPGSLSTC